MRTLRALDPGSVPTMEWLEHRYPSPALHAAEWTLDWAEAPLDLLVDPAVPTDDLSLQCYGYYRGGLTWPAAPALDRLCSVVLAGATGPRPGPPVWRRSELPTTVTIDFRERRPADLSPSVAFVRDMIWVNLCATIQDVLSFALLYPRILANPYEHELALFERGLVPIAAHAGVCQIFRPSREAVTVPAWLPVFRI